MRVLLLFIKPQSSDWFIPHRFHGFVCDGLNLRLDVLDALPGVQHMPGNISLTFVLGLQLYELLPRFQLEINLFIALLTILTTL